MTREERENTLHCLKVMIDEEVCEECELYGTTGTDHCEADCVRVAIEVLKKEPRKGKWTKLSNTIPCMNCPICGSTFTLILGGDKMHYCPNCGADMKEDEE